MGVYGSLWCRCRKGASHIVRTLADFERLLRPFAAKNTTCAQRFANQGSVAVASGASTGK
jgi:hypothetical protein